MALFGIVADRLVAKLEERMEAIYTTDRIDEVNQEQEPGLKM